MPAPSPSDTHSVRTMVGWSEPDWVTFRDGVEALRKESAAHAERAQKAAEKVAAKQVTSFEQLAAQGDWIRRNW
jgi:hypothetical protein